MSIPYTYLIGWSKQNQWYYGVRYAKKADPKELWVSYFTSSHHVDYFRKQHGEPDVVIIRKRFDDTRAARLWETKVLQRLKVPENPRFLNRTRNTAIDPEAGLRGSLSAAKRKRGKPHTAEHSMKIAIALTGKHRPMEVREKIGATRKARKIPSSNIDKKLSDSHRESLRESALNRAKYPCTVCGMICIKANLNRWHNDNCRRNK